MITTNGTFVTILCNVNCISIYTSDLLGCVIGGLQYVGETVHPFNKRVNDHIVTSNSSPIFLLVDISLHLATIIQPELCENLKIKITENNPKWDERSRRDRKNV